MRHASIRQRFPGSTFLMINGRAPSGARADLRVTRTGGRVLVLLVMLLAAHAGRAHGAEAPFIPIDLGSLGGLSSAATGVNDSGQVIGSNFAPGTGEQNHAFSWTAAGGMVDLGTLGGPLSQAFAVNDSGQVVGASDTAGGERHAFSWTAAGGMVDLGTIGGGSSSAFAVNKIGQVVGLSSIGNPQEQRAVLWLPISSLGCESLADCNLKGANLAGAYLSGRDLTDVNLKGANLVRANLTGANLKNTNLKGANLANANLTGARLKGTNVKDVIWSNTICPDGTNSDNNGGTCVKHL